jgi:hypothetical protein
MASAYCSHVLSESSRYLIWIGSDQEKTFGPTISSLIKRNLGPERMTLWDSKKRGMINGLFWIDCCMPHFIVGGRPDVMKLIREAYQLWGAEVVFITSNLQGNREMMEGCKLEGIPAVVRFFLVFEHEIFWVLYRERFGTSDLVLELLILLFLFIGRINSFFFFFFCNRCT